MEHPFPIGTKVKKASRNPFKSGFKTNTIKGFMGHPKLGVPCYCFEEDDSYVECRRCILVEES